MNLSDVVVDLSGEFTREQILNAIGRCPAHMPKQIQTDADIIVLDDILKERDRVLVESMTLSEFKSIASVSPVDYSYLILDDLFYVSTLQKSQFELVNKPVFEDDSLVYLPIFGSIGYGVVKTILECLVLESFYDEKRVKLMYKLFPTGCYNYDVSRGDFFRKDSSFSDLDVSDPIFQNRLFSKDSLKRRLYDYDKKW